MFESLQPAPPDPILGLTEAFAKDANPKKINLGVGVFKDATGRTPTLASVREAQKRFVAADAPMTYLPILGSPNFGAAVQRLVFGEGSSVISDRRARTAHAPGGTGALRVAADFLAQVCGKPKVWMSNPTWANHGAVFTAAGLATGSYPYYDAKAQRLDFDAMVSALSQVPRGDAVLLQIGRAHV